MDILQDKAALDALKQVIRSFNEVRPVEGRVQMRFDVRPLQDSDNNSVIDVYLYRVDDETEEPLPEGSEHMQMLSGTIPPEIIGYDVEAFIHPPDEQNVITVDILGRHLASPDEDAGAPFVEERIPPEYRK